MNMDQKCNRGEVEFGGINYENDMYGDNTNASENADIDFLYSDTDTHPNEIAELYSYTEQSEFQLNSKAFDELMESFKIQPSWQKLNDVTRKSVVLKLLDQLELSDQPARIKAARCILYLAQGCFLEVQSDHEQQVWTRSNVMMMYQLGVFSAIVELLSLEMENTVTASVATRKMTVSLADSTDLRIILSILYIMTEVIWAEKQNPDSEYKNHVESFTSELNLPIAGELLTVKLFGMITRFCSGTAPHFPMKKVLLLLWKISLVGLGGIETLKKLKDQYREELNLAPVTEDTLEITKRMRSSSPPATTSDILDNRKRNHPFRRQNLIKQGSLNEQEQISMEMEAQQSENEEDASDFFSSYNDPTMDGGQKEAQYSPVMPIRNIERLPWTPKVRQKDIDQFLDATRNKFIGFTLPEDNQSLAGLPQPIHEGFRTLKQHIYVSLADVRIKREEEISRYPLLKIEGDIPINSVEILYQAILPNLPQYMIALLKILLAAAPTSKAKTESINIMADVLPEEMPMTVTQSTKLGIDVNRHKEIIVKAVSAILLLYLKHFKINHVYQFEFMSQHLVFANCIPLVLKFFNQHIMTYIGSKNSIPISDFPACILGEPPELTADSFVIGATATYSWRNIFSCINLLRVLNKLTKWKHSRIMMLVVFKSAPILKQTLKVRHAMMQLYVLKLLKMQTRYLGRQWRKSNMKTISAIYSKVRHRLNDDWAFGNDLDARPWDFQTEECSLRACVDRFNNRRYFTNTIGPNAANNQAPNAGNNNSAGNGDPNEYDPNLINCYMNEGLQEEPFNYAPGYGGWDENVELSDEFKQEYETWLQQEVYNTQINWDSLMSVTYDCQ